MAAEVMVDSPVWIEYFRRGEGEIFDAVDRLLDSDRVALCGMVELEIIQGLRHRERETVTDLFGALPYIETERQDYLVAGERLGELRRGGITIPSSDCLIGILCLRRGLLLLTLDSHFDHLPDVERSLRRALTESGGSIRHQRGKPTQRPTLRWVFQMFQAMHMFDIDGTRAVSNLTEERRSILGFLGASCQKYYLLC